MTLNVHVNRQSTVNVFSRRRPGARRELLAAARLRSATRHPGRSLAEAVFGLHSEEAEFDSPVRLSGNSRSVEERPILGLTPTFLLAEAGLLLGDAHRGEERLAAALDDEDEGEDEDLEDDDLDEDDEEDFEDEDDEEDFQDEDDDLDDEDDEDLDDEVDEEE